MVNEATWARSNPSNGACVRPALKNFRILTNCPEDGGTYEKYQAIDSDFEDQPLTR
jgi:hypothetical protein